MRCGNVTRNLSSLRRKGMMMDKEMMNKKMKKVMGEYKMGDLHSGSKDGPMVKNRSQVVAIGLSEARKATSKRKVK